jgi:hypothetical protein
MIGQTDCEGIFNVVVRNSAESRQIQTFLYTKYSCDFQQSFIS